MSAPLLRLVSDYCERHGLLARGEPLLAMVSGGADSICMMHLLEQIHDGPLHVATVDHGLREAGAAEVQQVSDIARRLGCECHVERLSLEDGPDLQERARDGRLAVAERLADDLGCSRIALGHTATDQAETVLFRIARGTARMGARGMAPRRDRLIRPLLEITRDQTREWCAAHGIDVIDDPSNEDPRFTRSRVRHGLLPALNEIHPGAERNVAAFADRLRDEDALLTELVDAAWARCVGTRGLKVAHVRAESDSVKRLLVRRLIADAALGGGARESRHLDRVRDLIDRPAEIQLPGGTALIVDDELVVRQVERGPR